MTLSQQDAELFYAIWNPFMDFVNKKYKINPNWDLAVVEYDQIAMASIAEFLWQDADTIIDQYLAEKGKTLSSEEISILESWKKHVTSRFLLERNLKKGSILFELKSTKQIYLVKGIKKSLDDILSMYSMPLMIMTTLIPFKDVIITDGLVKVVTPMIIMGGGMKKIFHNEYMAAKKDNRIINSLLS